MLDIECSDFVFTYLSSRHLSSCTEINLLKNLRLLLFSLVGFVFILTSSTQHSVYI